VLRFFLLSVALVGIASAVKPMPRGVIGIPTVIDGDTLEFGKQRVRLAYVDAPESSQSCVRNGQAYRCGQQAALALAEKIKKRNVTCTEKDTDKYGRMVAVCVLSSTGEDLNRWLVQQGYAVAYRAYGRQYVPDEEKARQAKRGVWAGAFQMPWDYRKNPKGPMTGGKDKQGVQALTPGTAKPAPTGVLYDPNGPDRDCGDFPDQASAQAFYEAAGGPARDPHRLDRNKDGVACESN